MAKQQQLWFVKYEHKTECDQVVFNFTLPLTATEEQAFEHGRAFITEAYQGQFKNVTAERVCRTSDTVLCFEPC